MGRSFSGERCVNGGLRSTSKKEKKKKKEEEEEFKREERRKKKEDLRMGRQGKVEILRTTTTVVGNNRNSNTRAGVAMQQ